MNSEQVSEKKIKLSVIGTRGPCASSGIETVCRELYPLLASEFDVTIYSRTPYVPKNIREFKGIRVKHLPTVNDKHLEAFCHTLLATLHAMMGPADILHFHAQGPALFTLLPRLLTPWKKVVYTCHAIDWQRKKWGRLAASIIRAGEWCSAHFPHRRTAVSQTLVDHYEKTYRQNTELIPNGTSSWAALPARQITQQFGLKTRKYLLFVGRLVPEKAIHELIEAYHGIPYNRRNGLKLVIAGGSAATANYCESLRQLAGQDQDIILTGFAEGSLLHELYANAAWFITPSHLEGFNITVIEAMANGLPIIFSDLPVHQEFASLQEKDTPSFMRFFSTGNLPALQQSLMEALQTPQEDWNALSEQARVFANQHYRWEPIAKQYSALFNAVMAAPKRTPHFLMSNLHKGAKMHQPALATEGSDG